MGVASGCNLWVWLSRGGCGYSVYIGVGNGCCVRRYIDFFILLIPTPFVLALFCSSSYPCFYVYLKNVFIHIIFFIMCIKVLKCILLH